MCERTASVAGEMFFPSDGKMGFCAYRSSLKYCDQPFEVEPITEQERSEIFECIKNDFANGGHIFEMEH